MVGLMAMFFPVLLMLSTLALQRVETQLGPQRLRTSSLHPDRCSLARSNAERAAWRITRRELT
jgi:hypothetical protein